ncbi:hypothetical protein AAG570_014111 [Ranatra chinensis]|uniref:Reverse transcriptase domain-containing protein n=1 Tax=Ranatra chinensis TaxID=642074 RepID=A0ABD0YAN7_9HEMI
MDEFLEGLDEGAVQVYMDDIIVFSRSEQEHGEHLVQLLRRLKEFGLKVSRGKTMFFLPSETHVRRVEISARVSRWKERLAAYSFTISHNKGKDNGVADCLSRMVNALDAPTPSPGVAVEEPDLPTVQVPASRETPSRSPEPDRRNVESRVMTGLSDTLNDKAIQLVARIVSGDTVRSTNLEDRTKSLTKMVAEELARCEVCARAEYVRTPQETPQMVTPTPEKPLEVVEAEMALMLLALSPTLKPIAILIDLYIVNV